MLRGHDGPFADQAAEAVGVDSLCVLVTNPQAARAFEAVEQRDDIGGSGRLRIIPQPGEAGAAQLGLNRQ